MLNFSKYLIICNLLTTIVTYRLDRDEKDIKDETIDKKIAIF